MKRVDKYLHYKSLINTYASLRRGNAKNAAAFATDAVKMLSDAEFCHALAERRRQDAIAELDKSIKKNRRTSGILILYSGVSIYFGVSLSYGTLMMMGAVFGMQSLAYTDKWQEAADKREKLKQMTQGELIVAEKAELFRDIKALPVKDLISNRYFMQLEQELMAHNKN